MTLKFPNVQTQTEFFPFVGGLDQVSPAITIKPGSLIGVQNYIPDLSGGYRLAGMFERYDGRTAPSSATYQAVACTLTSTPAIGAAVVIGAASGLFAGLIPGGCVLTGVSGTVPGNTSMTVSGSPVGTTAANVGLSAPTALEDAQRIGMAAQVYRNLIAAPSGSGPIRGVVQFGALTYCFRDNAGATAGQMFVSSPSGWTLVDLGEEVAFSNANASVNDGDVLTQGSVTATIRRVVVETGTLASGTNTGRLIIAGRTGGDFSGAAATSTGGGNLTLSGAQQAITLPAGGQYQFDIYNFSGQLATTRLYGANGVGRAFEFDGSTFVPLRTGAATDTPRFIKAHKRYLFLSIGSSVLNSSVGNPYRYIVSEGAGEIAVGDTVTGLESLPGESLGILCRNSSYQLAGASPASWTLKTIRSDVGAVAYSTQTMSDTYMFDDRGITSVKQSDLYGNFETATLTRKVQPLISAARGKVVGAWVNRQRALYGVMLNDGAAIVLCIQGETLMGVTALRFPFTPSCVFSGEDNTGQERIFVGATSGMVYELDKGQSADGDNLEAFVRLAYNTSKSPTVRKRYRKMVLQMTADAYTELRFSAEISYGRPEIPGMVPDTVGAQLGGAFWDAASWDTFYWDAQDVYQPEISLSGSGENLSVTFYKNNALDAGHVLQGGIIHYTPRRLQR